MTTVEEVLRRHGYLTTEDDLAQRLDALLADERRTVVAIDMTADEVEFLGRHGGVEPVTTQQLAELDARSTARLAAEATLALSRAEIAELLEVVPSRISHQVAAGRLYSYLGSGRRPMFPDWQITISTPRTGHPGQKVRVLPQLADVIKNVPLGAHPIAIRSFMTTPNQALTTGDGEAMSPVDWLVSGGDSGIVAEMATTLGEQV